MHRDAVEFEAGGKAYRLHFSTNAISRFEDRFDKSFLSAVGDNSGAGAKISVIRALFWAGLGVETLDEAGDVMDELGLHASSRLIGKAVAAAFPDAEDDGQDEGAASGNGKKAPAAKKQAGSNAS